MKTEKEVIKKSLTGSILIQLCGFIGVIACILNLFINIALPFSWWWVLIGSIITFVVGTYMGTTLVSENTYSSSDEDKIPKGFFDNVRKN